MKTKIDKVYKGIIFAGCSFTWGQGLNYYSNLSTLKEPGFGRYNSHLITKSQLKYLKSIRFPRLVANHFDTFEFVHKQNGRSNQEMISFWKEYFGEIPRSYLLDISDLDDKIYYDEISVLFFQVTQFGRNEIEFSLGGETYKMNIGSLYHKENETLLEKYLLEQNLTLGQLEIRELQKNIIMIKEFLEGIENKNIKTFIFTWPDENVKFILEDEWLKERFIKFEYNNSEYNSIQTLLQKNTELSIMNDYENFITPPKDDHPSKKCHEIIANKLIEKLKNYENKNR
jgi:hypothetical protein